MKNVNMIKLFTLFAVLAAAILTITPSLSFAQGEEPVPFDYNLEGIPYIGIIIGYPCHLNEDVCFDTSVLFAVGNKTGQPDNYLQALAGDFPLPIPFGNITADDIIGYGLEYNSIWYVIYQNSDFVNTGDGFSATIRVKAAVPIVGNSYGPKNE